MTLASGKKTREHGAIMSDSNKKLKFEDVSGVSNISSASKKKAKSAMTPKSARSSKKLASAIKASLKTKVDKENVTNGTARAMKHSQLSPMLVVPRKNITVASEYEEVDINPLEPALLGTEIVTNVEELVKSTLDTILLETDIVTESPPDQLKVNEKEAITDVLRNFINVLDSSSKSITEQVEVKPSNVQPSKTEMINLENVNKKTKQNPVYPLHTMIDGALSRCDERCQVTIDIANYVVLEDFVQYQVFMQIWYNEEEEGLESVLASGPNMQIMLLRRYSQFLALRDELLNCLKASELVTSELHVILPNFPPKQLFPFWNLWSSRNFLDCRRSDLQRWLSAVLYNHKRLLKLMTPEFQENYTQKLRSFLFA